MSSRRGSRPRYDAVVVGSGPNGLACAITLAREGRSVLVLERNAVAGGGMRTDERTLPGFRHDTCSAVHPLGFASPFFRSLPLHEHGLEWIHAPAEVAHPLDDGSVALLRRSVRETARTLGRDEQAYIGFFEPLAARFDELLPELLRPAIHWPKHPFLLARFGFPALRSATGFAGSRFVEPATRALIAGIAAHANAPLTRSASASVGLVLHLCGHAGGWPIPRGGSQSITRALLSYFGDLGGELVTQCEVARLADIPPADQVFFDQTPRQIQRILGSTLPPAVDQAFHRYRYGPGVFKMDWALSAPIPWKNPDAALAPTVHLGGTLEEIARSEDEIAAGKSPTRPYVLLAQPSLFDPTRAPPGQHVAWAYCHVPAGSTVDQTEAIESQIERFAPGFRRTILMRTSRNTQALESDNPNLVGGDIGGGAATGKQLFFRPRVTIDPYRIDGQRFWICSSSTPPGPGVHGMCGYLAARASVI